MPESNVFPSAVNRRGRSNDSVGLKGFSDIRERLNIHVGGEAVRQNNPKRLGHILKDAIYVHAGQDQAGDIVAISAKPAIRSGLEANCDFKGSVLHDSETPVGFTPY